MPRLLIGLLLILVTLSHGWHALARNGNPSVSGISSGGFFAVQMHVAFSSEIIGAGIVAGGPYWCSLGNADTALAVCKDPSLIDIPTLTVATAYAARLDTIDDPVNLKSSRIWLFSGKLDSVVNPGVVVKLQDYYGFYLASPTDQISTVFNFSAEHAMITNDYGNTCSTLDPPFINNCQFDAAGALLSWILDTTLNAPGEVNVSNVIELDQAGFIPRLCPYTPQEIGLFNQAYAYIPVNCQSPSGSPCSLHVAFHGCEQTINDIGSQFYTHTGYNAWAETNNLIILYPQAQANALNPKGCFDWWGYSGEDFATRVGYQMATVKSMMDNQKKNSS